MTERIYEDDATLIITSKDSDVIIFDDVVTDMLAIHSSMIGSGKDQRSAMRAVFDHVYEVITD